jgi:hypothetical protein
MSPQKLAKDCLSNVGFPPFLTQHKAMLVRFKDMHYAKKQMKVLMNNNCEL